MTKVSGELNLSVSVSERLFHHLKGECHRASLAETFLDKELTFNYTLGDSSELHCASFTVHKNVIRRISARAFREHGIVFQIMYEIVPYASDFLPIKFFQVLL